MVTPVPPAAMDSWNRSICLLGTPSGDMPSLVAALMKRLRRVSGPIFSGWNAGESMLRSAVFCMCVILVVVLAGPAPRRPGAGKMQRIARPATERGWQRENGRPRAPRGRPDGHQKLYLALNDR
ncbi:hypothetical protein D9M72_585750 [compost metagenome]